MFFSLSGKDNHVIEICFFFMGTLYQVLILLWSFVSGRPAWSHIQTLMCLDDWMTGSRSDGFPAKKRGISPQPHTVVLMSGQRRRCWHIIKKTVDQRLVLAGLFMLFLMGLRGLAINTELPPNRAWNHTRLDWIPTGSAISELQSKGRTIRYLGGGGGFWLVADFFICARKK